MTNEQKAVQIAQESVINAQPLDFASVEYGALKMAKWKDEIKVQSNDIKWKPSKEEMSVLYDLSHLSSFQFTDEQNEALMNLYEDLKQHFFNGKSLDNMFENM